MVMFPSSGVEVQSKAAPGPKPLEHEHQLDSEQLFRNIAILREMMPAVHYYEESHWLAAAVSFREMCRSAKAQEVLRRAATIAWQFGHPAISNWLNTEILGDGERDLPAHVDVKGRTSLGAFLPSSMWRRTVLMRKRSEWLAAQRRLQ
jgi:hypothetical protein